MASEEARLRARTALAEVGRLRHALRTIAHIRAAAPLSVRGDAAKEGAYWNAVAHGMATGAYAALGEAVAWVEDDEREADDDGE